MNAAQFLRASTCLRHVAPGLHYTQLSSGEKALEDVADALSERGVLGVAAGRLSDDDWCAVVAAIGMLRPALRGVAS